MWIYKNRISKYFYINQIFHQINIKEQNSCHCERHVSTSKSWLERVSSHKTRKQGASGSLWSRAVARLTGR